MPIQSKIYKEDSSKGVAPVIGFLLILAIVFLAAGQFQANVVPAQERGEEANHFNIVESDISDLRTNIIKASSNGQLQTQRVRLGMTYDTLGITQTPVSGTLSLNESVPDIVISNAKNNNEASNYWTGDNDREYKTGILSYEVNYNRFANNADLYMENGYLYRDAIKNSDSRISLIPVSEQPIINGKQIKLYTLQSGSNSKNLTTSQIRPTTIEVNPTSAPMNAISIRNTDGSNIRFKIPSRLDESHWEDEILKNQMAPSCSEDNQFVKDVESGGDYYVNIVMCEDITYSLQMSRIDLQTRQSRTLIEPTEKEYIAVDDNQVVNIRERSVVNIQGEVRDKYNNGVLGVPVGAEAHNTNTGDCTGNFQNVAPNTDPTCDNSDTSTSQPGRSVSDTDGSVSFVYQSPEISADKEITFVYRFLD